MAEIICYTYLKIHDQPNPTNSVPHFCGTRFFFQIPIEGMFYHILHKVEVIVSQ